VQVGRFASGKTELGIRVFSGSGLLITVFDAVSLKFIRYTCFGLANPRLYRRPRALVIACAVRGTGRCAEVACCRYIVDTLRRYTRS
jgi:hypothetical protein